MRADADGVANCCCIHPVIASRRKAARQSIVASDIYSSPAISMTGLGASASLTTARCQASWISPIPGSVGWCQKIGVRGIFLRLCAIFHPFSPENALIQQFKGQNWLFFGEISRINENSCQKLQNQWQTALAGCHKLPQAAVLSRSGLSSSGRNCRDGMCDNWKRRLQCLGRAYSHLRIKKRFANGRGHQRSSQLLTVGWEAVWDEGDKKALEQREPYKGVSA